MERHLTLTETELKPVDLLSRRHTSGGTGAVIHFLGVVRGDEAGQPIQGLRYEAFVPMAEHQFQLLFNELEARWPAVQSIEVVHRLGPVTAGQPSLWVEVMAPHRAEAFASCQWLIDEMKLRVPIWKHPLLRSAT